VRRNYSDIAIAEAIAILGCVAFFAHLPGPVMLVLGLCLFAAPGYVWSEVFLSRRDRGLERVAVGTGLALMVPVFGGIVLYAAGIPLNRTAWVGVLSVATLVGAAVALITRRRRRDDPAPRRPARTRRWSAWHAVAFGAAAVIAAGAVGLAVVSADAQKYSGYTQLWLTPLPGQPSRASLGVDNEQGGATQYRLVLRRKGQVSRTRRMLAVAAVVAAFVVTGLGGWGLHAATTSPPASALSSATLLTATHQSAGQIYLYDSGSRWLYMSVNIPSGSGAADTGTVICQVEGPDGHVTTVGSFQLANGYGYWGSPAPATSGPLTGARLVTASGTVLATATFAA